MLEESNMEPAHSAEPAQAAAVGDKQNNEAADNQEGKGLAADIAGVWNRLYTSTVGKARSDSAAADSAEQGGKTVEAESAGEGKSDGTGSKYWESAQSMLRTGASSIQKYSTQVASATRSAAESAYQTVSTQSAVVYNSARTTLGDFEAKRHSPAENLNKLADGLAYDNLHQEEGAIELNIPPNSSHSQMSIVPQNCTIEWKFSIKSHDLGFAVRKRVQEMGGAVEEDIQELKRYSAGEVVTGEWKAADGKDHALVFAWDNKHSRIRPKTFVYRVKIYPPGTQPRIRAASHTPPSTPAPSQHQSMTASAPEPESLLDIPPHDEAEQKQDEPEGTKPKAQEGHHGDGNDDEEAFLAEISLPGDQAGDVDGADVDNEH